MKVLKEVLCETSEARIIVEVQGESGVWFQLDGPYRDWNIALEARDGLLARNSALAGHLRVAKVVIETTMTRHYDVILEAAA